MCLQIKLFQDVPQDILADCSDCGGLNFRAIGMQNIDTEFQKLRTKSKFKELYGEELTKKFDKRQTEKPNKNRIFKRKKKSNLKFSYLYYNSKILLCQEITIIMNNII